MLTVEQFETLIDTIKEQRNIEDKIYSLTEGSLSFTNFSDNYFKIINILTKELFGEIYDDIFFEWLYAGLKEVNENGIDYNIGTVEELYMYMVLQTRDSRIRKNG